MAALLAAFVLYIVLAGSVSKRLSPSDLHAIATLRADPECSDVRQFGPQIRCIRYVQRAIQLRVPDMRCAKNGVPIEPMNFLQRGYGCCFDRARFISKALEHYGFRTRHVALYDRSRFGAFGALLPGTRSHATTEVLTRRGWMGVDSNEPFLLLTRDGKPFTYSQIPDVRPADLLYTPAPRDFFAHRLTVIYGLYSRHGQFHGPNLPAPEINYPEFIRYNFNLAPGAAN